MKKLFILLLICICASCVYSLEVTCDKGMEQYKPLVEEQIVKPLEEVYNTRMDACGLFINDEEISKELGYLLGCEDSFKNIRQKIRYAFYDSKVIETTLSHIKIISYEKAKKQPILSVGYIIYSFPDEKSVDLTFSSLMQLGDENDFYLPILIDKNGKIVKKDEIIDGLISVGGNTKLKAPLMLLGIVNEIQNEILKINFPFSRWFNDGLDYKITSLVLHKQNFQYANDFDNLFALTDRSKEIKSKVNLLTFPQSNLSNAYTKDKDLENANIQYSCELMNKIFDKIGRDGFHKMTLELKLSPFLTSEQMCNIINKVTNCDAYSMLLEYIPEGSKQFLDKNKYNSLYDECKKLMEEKKHKEAITIYNSLLEANPYDYNSRLNLALCYRETKELLLSEEQIFIAANAMPLGTATINVNGETNANFLAVLGKYLYIQGALGDSLNLLNESYKLEPAEDVKKTIDSINLTKENMQKELYGGK